ncbi:uncharacterized protein PHACADRAFT_203515 [Phanerochaete carnosa HHB-10118-sp]|uniref:Uncharacterized protein n=1 Tax=Phanerochaete carnosa (strain HHB-10118-sp) TaxID=650164 RepID=K5WLH1_PHACS|nr:uncharacterized protein PHACADRAFT_203515 [Phanerochaete carnosa HHB-10118-sp]EKM60275.1 hypothetical protein PHACADRAFT_203515 [Phanerochaete carnosa HHB-10118-sp]
MAAALIVILNSASLWDAVDWEQLLSFLRSVEELTLCCEVLRIRECAPDNPYFAVQQLPPSYTKLADLARSIVANGGETLSVHAEAAD